jgi:hypothetical protein
MRKQLIVAATVLAGGMCCSAAFGQCGCGSAGPAYVPAADYSACCAPPLSCGAPVTEVAYDRGPATYDSPPVRAYYPGPVARPYVAYYSPPAYRAVPGRTIYGTPKMYVPGQPLRNVWRAITP